ncbi:MAG TPA: alpha/beta hydrolase [Anaerolineae bacterium]|nr:alpha/beta hydrolase [Anaerolineae bacterium]
MTNKIIVFVHGAWVTPLCWNNFKGYFESRGYECVAPAWPYKDRSIDELRRNPYPAFGRLGLIEIVDHYDKIIRALAAPPILIGHSYGGLFVQMLLDRGLGAAGVAIDSAPPKGVLPFYPSVIKANFGVLSTPGGWRKVVRMSFAQFQYAFVNALPEADQRAAYDQYVVPETGRVFFQSAFSMFNNATTVNFKNSRRAPLLLIAGGADHITPPAMNRVNFAKYKNSGAVTDYKEFAGRCHWIIAQPGWEEVASYSEDWLKRHFPA